MSSIEQEWFFREAFSSNARIVKARKNARIRVHFDQGLEEVEK